MAIQSSPNGYKLATADLGSGAISTDALARIVAGGNMEQGIGQGDEASPAVMALLAAITKKLTPKNVRYAVYPYALIGQQSIQILPQNTKRAFLLITVNPSDNTEVRVAFQQGPTTAQEGTNDALRDRSFPVTSRDGVPGFMQFQPAPINEISILSDLGATGIIIEGVEV